MLEHKNYERRVVAGIEESLSKIVALIPDGSFVLDVGCGSGMLGAYLTRNKGCVVDGVDLNVDAVNIAENNYRKTFVLDLESENLVEKFCVDSYDFIVVADVIEHLVNPGILLEGVRALIKPSGTVIFSVPNITHISVGLELLLGKFHYSDNGLLDRTHLRFFSRKSLLEKLSQHGLYAYAIQTIKKEVKETEFSKSSVKLFPSEWLKKIEINYEDALTYQWIVSTKKDRASIEDNIILESDYHWPSLIFTSELYWSTLKEPDYSDKNKIIGRLIESAENVQTIEFHFSDCEMLDDLKNIRIDPVSERKLFLIVYAEIVDSKKNIIWSWDSQLGAFEILGARLLRCVKSGGCLFDPISDDPQWLPDIGEEILRRIDPGSIFRFEMRVDGSLVNFCSNQLETQVDQLETQVDQLKTQVEQFGQDLVVQSHIISAAKLREKNLQQLEGELRGFIVALKKTIDSYQASTSWRLTKPLRMVSSLWKDLGDMLQVYRMYRLRNPGAKGFSRLVKRLIGLFNHSGFSGVVNVVCRKNSLIWSEAALKSSMLSAPLILRDAEKIESKVNMDVAVHIHVFYPELILDIRSYLENIPVGFHCYVTTDTPDKAGQIKKILFDISNMTALDIRIVENRGRDIYPLVSVLASDLARHELVLHIHTKCSPHNAWALSGWRRYLMESLLGTPKRVTAIFQQFMQDQTLGIFFPAYYHSIKSLVYPQRTNGGYIAPTPNDEYIHVLLDRAGKKKNELHGVDVTLYPAGDMFWFRGRALEPFIKMNLTVDDFAIERGQVNGTLAHAIERMFPYFAKQVDLSTKAFLSEVFLSPDCCAHEANLAHQLIDKKVISEPVIIFDHNNGGGANTYSKKLVGDILEAGNTVLRIYCNEGLFFAQWHSANDGMLFYFNTTKQLFCLLLKSRSKRVILNSLYGVPDIEDISSAITNLADNLKADLDIKMHDFYALCPSPHLLNFESAYCGVPEDGRVCSRCLKKNHGWFHSWYPEEKKPTEITQWRKPFINLLDAANTVTFFDESTVDIVAKAFDLDMSKIKVVPHDATHFVCHQNIKVDGPLHIGILGTLSIAKGGEIVKLLHNYLHEKGLGIPITIIGPSLVSLPKEVTVWGAYEPNDLPEIISYRDVNVIFIPSIVPETFSYTISEAIEMKLPIVAFDIGAQGARVRKYKLGKVVPLGSSPETILLAIQEVKRVAVSELEQS